MFQTKANPSPSNALLFCREEHSNPSIRSPGRPRAFITSSPRLHRNMRRVSSRQRLVSWDKFDATAGSRDDSLNGNESSLKSYNYCDEESHNSGYESAHSQFFLSSTALDELGEIQEKNESDRKGTKLWTKGRKRDRKSFRYHCAGRIGMCKTLESPKPAHTITSTDQKAPTIVPSYSWESNESTPCKMACFDDLNDDLYIDIFSFLDMASLRSIMSTNRRYRNFTVSEDARNSLWMDRCEKIWHIQRKRCEAPLKFVDDFHLPIAAISQASITVGFETMNRTVDTTNLSLLLNLAPSHFPTTIDQITLSPRRRLSRVIQQTIPTYRLEEEDQLIRCYKDSLTGRSVVQYTGDVGEGDRCVRSNHPLPRPTYSEDDIIDSCTEMLIGSRSHEKWMMNFLRGSSKPMMLPPAWSSLSTSSTSKQTKKCTPFVVPFVDRSSDDTTTTINVTPRFVSYFEVSILKEDCKDENDENETATPTRGRSRHRSAFYNACVAVGVATKKFYFQSRMPGWDKQSYGYHGDDGGIFHSSGGMLEKFGPKFGAGDTVGCGVDYIEKGIFYTLNGEFLGYAWKAISNEMLQKDLFPIVGIDTNSPIHMNFGSSDSGPFQFDLSEFIKKHEQKIASMYSLDEFGESGSSTYPRGTKGTPTATPMQRGRSLSGPLKSRRQRRGLIGRRSHSER